MSTLLLGVLDNMKSLNVETLLKEEQHEGAGPKESLSIEERLKQSGLNKKLGARGRIKIEASPVPCMPA